MTSSRWPRGGRSTTGINMVRETFRAPGPCPDKSQKVGTVCKRSPTRRFARRKARAIDKIWEGASRATAALQGSCGGAALSRGWNLGLRLGRADAPRLFPAAREPGPSILPLLDRSRIANCVLQTISCVLKRRAKHQAQYEPRTTPEWRKKRVFSCGSKCGSGRGPCPLSHQPDELFHHNPKGIEP